MGRVPILPPQALPTHTVPLSTSVQRHGGSWGWEIKKAFGLIQQKSSSRYCYTTSIFFFPKGLSITGTRCPESW